MGNTSPINQGQLLHLAEQAIAELDAQLAPIGGSGFKLDDLLDEVDANYYAPANLGQLKNVSSQFYDVFAQIGFDASSAGWPSGMILDVNTGYPWAENQVSANYSPD